MEQNIQDGVQQMKLPKNIRQIGIVDKGNRIYIEDYVVTYMKRILREKKDGFGVAALYGQVYYLEKTKYVFIQAATYQAPEEYEKGPEKEMIAYFRQQAEQYFPDLSPVGIAVLHSKENRIPGAWYQKSKLAGLLGHGAVLIDFIAGNDEAEYSFLLEDGMQILDGHFIYYEKNEIMQNYLIDYFERGKMGQAAERDEEVSESCKMRLSEKKDERGQGFSSLCFSMSSVCLLIGMCVVGLVVLGYYQKAKNSSSTDVSISTVSQENAYELTDVLNLSGIQENTISGADSDAAYLDPNLDPNQSTENIPVDNSMVILSDTDPAVVDNTSAGLQNPESSIVSQTPESAAENDAQSQSGSVESSAGAGSQTSEDAAENDAQSGSVESSTGAGSQTPEDAAENDVQSQSDSVSNISYTSYEIERGDTLYDICMKRYGSISNMSLICNLNGIENQNNIYYGQTIVLP